MGSLNKCFSQENITEFFNMIRNNIVTQAVLELSGDEKKANVDKAVVSFIKTTFVSKNIIVSFLINVLIDFVPRITQALFDVLNTKAGELE